VPDYSTLLLACMFPAAVVKRIFQVHQLCNMENVTFDGRRNDNVFTINWVGDSVLFF